MYFCQVGFFSTVFVCMDKYIVGDFNTFFTYNSIHRLFKYLFKNYNFNIIFYLIPFYNFNINIISYKKLSIADVNIDGYNSKANAF